MKKVLLSSLPGLGPDLRAIVAERLGCDIANIPEANVPDLAKSLGLAPAAQVVQYKTKADKVGLYLACDDAVPGGRFGGGGKLFHRLGDPEDAATPGLVNRIHALADAFEARVVAMRDLADSVSDAIEDDPEPDAA